CGASTEFSICAASTGTSSRVANLRETVKDPAAVRSITGTGVDMSAHQQAAIRRLEALFRDVKLEQQQNNPEIVKLEIDSSCCDIHGKHAKENCWNRRGSVGNAYQTRRDSFGRRDGYPGTSPSRRGSLGLPMSPPKKELHPSCFPNTLRKNPLVSSMSSINHTKKDIHASTLSNSSLRRDPVGRSMGCLKKDTMSNYNSPLRRDYVAKSMTSLQRPPSRRDTSNLSSLFASSPLSQSPLKSSLSSSNSDLKARSTSNLKSCLAGSSGNLRSNLNVTLSTDHSMGSNGNLKKDGKFATPVSGRRGSYDRRRLSTDSLDNTKRNSWDPGRRGSSGSSGGWDDPIWEEGTFDAGISQGDEVAIPRGGEVGRFSTRGEGEVTRRERVGHALVRCTQLSTVVSDPRSAIHPR
ncbi:uncharacterized protein LOC108625980, partial [Ceratina calcarata]|uniref:Uncharacterized protein LOC108625980 n=1 Tax=Ceratina calcarata TaxID=156304 RepID=A0AAJ7N7Q3_9HYME